MSNNIDRTALLENIVRDQQRLLKECQETIVAEYGEGPEIVSEIEDMSDRVEALLGIAGK